MNDKYGGPVASNTNLRSLVFLMLVGGASRLQRAHKITEAVSPVCIYQRKLLSKTEEPKSLRRVRQAKKEIILSSVQS